MNQIPFISIIIPVRNAFRTLPTTFNYLFRIDYPRDRLEIVMADGGSSDDTVAEIKRWQEKHPFIKLVEIPNCPSPGFARNKALKVAQGDFLFFTDGDCAPTADWIWKMLGIFKRDEKIGAVGGEVYTLRVENNNLVEAWCEVFGFNKVAPRYGHIREGYFPDFPAKPSPVAVAGHQAYFFGTCNVAYRKKALDRAGAYFWERPTGEDMELSIRVRKSEFKFYFLPEASVKHMHRANLQQLLKVWRSYAEAHTPLIDKYVEKRKFDVAFQFLPKSPTVSLPCFMRGFIYIGNLHCMLTFILLSMLFGLIALKARAYLIYTAVSFLGFLYFGWRYFRQCSNKDAPASFLPWCAMKLLTNLYFIRGGLKGLFKYKILCIEPSF